MNDTQQAEIVSQMALAHRALGSWAAVAKLCGDSQRTGKPISGTLAWLYAAKRRHIPDAVIEAWQTNVTPAMLKARGPRQRVPRVSIECSPEVRDALRNSIKKYGDTWDDALRRILADTEPGSAPHLFSFLDTRTLGMVAEELEVAICAKGAGGYYLDDTTIRTIQWWLDRLQLELSMRNTPDWARKD